MPNHTSFSPLLHYVFFHKRTVRASSSRMIISACVFLTGKRGNQAHGIVIFIDRWNSSVTHDIAKNRQLLRYRRLGNKTYYGILGQVWYLIVSIPDLCTLTFIKLLISLLKNDVYPVSFITASHTLTKNFTVSTQKMLVSPFPKALVLQDESFGKNYLSFLAFTRNYEQTSGIIVLCFL